MSNELVMRARKVVAELAHMVVRDEAERAILDEASELIAELTRTAAWTPPVIGAIHTARDIFKFRPDNVRIIFSNSKFAEFPNDHGKIFALIGPFNSYGDRMDLQMSLIHLLRGYNLETNDD